jgi:hypothetical protein
MQQQRIHGLDPKNPKETSTVFRWNCCGAVVVKESKGFSPFLVQRRRAPITAACCVRV